MELAAEGKAIPFDLTKPEDRAQYTMEAAEGGQLTPAQALQNTRPPIERVPLSPEGRIFYEAYSSAVGAGAKPGDAIQTAQNAVLAYRGPAAQASSAGTAKGKVQEDVPLTPAQNLQFATPQGTTFAGVKGETPATPQMREQITQLDNASAIMDTLSGLADRLITAKSAPEALIQGGKLYAGAIAKSNPMAASYRDTQQMFLGVLSRTLGGERGVLTDRDIDRVSRGLPQFRDTETIKNFKLGAIRNILNVAIEAKKRVITGNETNPQYRTKVDTMLNNLERQTPAPAAGGWSIKVKGK
jgi:hypothetical protein